MNELQNIAKFEVTDRSYAFVLELFGLTDDDVDAFPARARIINFGGGIYQQFESGLLTQRQDLSVFSVDPSLGVFTIDRSGNRTPQGFRIDLYERKNASYLHEPTHPVRNELSLSESDAIRFDAQRKRWNAGVSHTVAALATDVPFPADYFDIAFDCLGPMHYIKPREDKERYMQEVQRLLRPGGVLFTTMLDGTYANILSGLRMRFLPMSSFRQDSYIVYR